MLRFDWRWDFGSDFYCIKFLPSIEFQLSYFTITRKRHKSLKFFYFDVQCLYNTNRGKRAIKKVAWCLFCADWFGTKRERGTLVCDNMDVYKCRTEVCVQFTLLRSIRGTIVWNTRETRNINSYATWLKLLLFPIYVLNKIGLSRGEICVANFIPPANCVSF